jgi:hypothetical protein
MGLERKLAGGVAAVAASVLPFALDVPGAAAAEHAEASRGFDHRFRNGSGVTVTCHVDGFSSVFRESGDPTFDASAFTSTSGPDSCDAFVTATARYRNASGSARESSASGENFVNLFNDDVASDYVVTHSVFFEFCMDNCSVTFETRPK